MVDTHTIYKTYKTCPKCKNISNCTYYVTKRVVRQTDIDITYQEVVHYKCQYCNHVWKE